MSATARPIPSADVLGLVLITAKVELDPLADYVGHGPRHTVETLYWLQEADQHQTLGQLVAHYGLDEGDAITIRFPTVAEERQQLKAVLEQAAPKFAGMPVRFDARIPPGQVALETPTDRVIVATAGLVDASSLHRWDGPKPSAPRDTHGLLIADPDAHLGGSDISIADPDDAQEQEPEDRL